MKILAFSSPWYAGVEIGIIDGEKYATELVYKKYNQGQIVEPLLKISIDDATQLMNNLWHCGIRPTNGEGSVGELKATQNHLKDMQKLVFKERTPKI